MQKRVWLGLSALAALAGALYVRSGVQAAPGKVYKVGDKVADFALKDDNGKTVRLSEFKGKPVVLTFYASW